METHRLKVVRCEESGLLGLIVDTLRPLNFTEGDIFVMTDSYGIAHDLTEHVNGLDNIGTVFDEFQAIGAIWATRGRWGDLRRDNVGSLVSLYDNMASDFIRMLRIANWHGIGGHIAEPPPETEEDQCFQDILEIVRKEAPVELEEDFDDFDLEEYLQQAYWGMQVGYAKQLKRYPGYFEATNRFWAIQEATEPVFKWIDHEGQEFKLTISDDLDVKVWEVYDEEEE